MQRNDELVELGVASEETKGNPIAGGSDELQLQKFGAGIADD
jgi:hypothetical protein